MESTSEDSSVTPILLQGKYVSGKQYAAMTGYSPLTIYRRCRDGYYGGRAVKFENIWLIRVEG